MVAGVRGAHWRPSDGLYELEKSDQCVGLEAITKYYCDLWLLTVPSDGLTIVSPPLMKWKVISKWPNREVQMTVLSGEM